MEFSDSWDGQTAYWVTIFNAIHWRYKDGTDETNDMILENLIGPLVESLDSSVRPVAQFAMGAFLHENKLNGRR